MSIAVFIPAKLGSTRLERKHLLKINRKPVIQLLIERIKRAIVPDLIVLCTTTSKKDNLLVELAKNNNIEFFRGSKSDILKRYRNASRKFGAEYIINVDGDDIFCEPMLIDATAKFLTSSNSDCVMWRKLPLGAAPIGINSIALEKVCKLKQTSNTETGWFRYFTETRLFKTKYLSPTDPELIAPHIRLTLDYPEDLALFRKIYANLKEPFSLKDIIHLFKKRPELININKDVSKKYWQHFKQESTSIKLKLVRN